MHKTQKYCPKCGKESSPYNLENDFCLEHFLEYFFSSIYKKKIRLKKCRQCNKLKIFDKDLNCFVWVEKNNKKLLSFLLDKLDFPSNILKYIIIEKLEKNTLKLKIQNKSYDLILDFGFVEGLCQNCKENSRSYSAIIQLRGEPLNVEKFYLFLEKLLTKEKIRILKIQDLDEGKNLYVNKKEDLVLLFSKNKIKFLRTSKLVGQRKDGKRIFLDTFLVKV